MILAMLVAAALALADSALAQTDGETPPLSIRTTGEARIAAQPNVAEIEAAVVTRAQRAERAEQANAEQTARVLGALKKIAGPAAVRTSGYSVRPEYRRPDEDTEPRIPGYVATNTVTVTLDDLERVGELIDAAITAGANRIGQVRFELKDRRAVYAEALRQAAARARSEAEALASALGLKVLRILTVVEQSAPGRPPVEPLRITALAAQSVTTPVEPGTIVVEARVTLTVEVAGASP